MNAIVASQAPVVRADPEAPGSLFDYLSASRLNLWHKCPLAFRLNYIDRVRFTTSPAVFVGRRVHAALEWHYRNRQLGRRMVVARVLGYGTSSDAHHITAPCHAGQAAAMRNCLADAGFAPEQVDYLNLHGTATKANDETEAAAVVEVFGPRGEQMPASSTKSMLGHALGASGAIEFVICVAAMRNQFVPLPSIATNLIRTSGSTTFRMSADRIPFVPPCQIRSLLAATMRVFSWERANDGRRSSTGD